MHDTDETELPCQDKARYATSQEARAAASYAKHRYGTKLKIYQCRYCSLWHLASDYDD